MTDNPRYAELLHIRAAEHELDDVPASYFEERAQARGADDYDTYLDHPDSEYDDPTRLPPSD